MTPNGNKKSPPEKKSSVKEDDDPDAKAEGDDEEYRWWEETQNDGSVKWTTLEHNGVLFPPPYEPLPENIKMKYDGKEVTLPPEAEEVAGFFAALIEAEHGKNPVFQENFFSDWLEVLKKHNAVLLYLIEKSNGRLRRSRSLRNAILDQCGNTSRQRKRRRRNFLKKRKQL
jgi:DNA topoisomerase IB